jgi:hypothetical protein
MQEESLKMKKYFTIFALGMMAMSTAAFAATTATGTNTVAPTLQISATIQSAVQLTLSTGTAAVNHCAVTAGTGTDYAMSFGSVNALALGTPSCGSSFAPTNTTTAGAGNAIYWSDYTLTPLYTSQAASANPTITAKVTADFAAPKDLTVVRDSANSSTVPTGLTSFVAVGTATADTIASAVASGTALTRFIGVQVSPVNATGIPTTAQTATVTFTLTVN